MRADDRAALIQTCEATSEYFRDINACPDFNWDDAYHVLLATAMMVKAIAGPPEGRDEWLAKAKDITEKQMSTARKRPENRG